MLPIADFLALLSLTTLTFASPLNPIDIRNIKAPTCPANGLLPPRPNYLSPTLIVPVSSRLPKAVFPATSFPLITPNDFCSIFNLIIPNTAVGKTCTLEFLFPNKDQTPSPFLYHGGGHFTFTGYAYGVGAVEGVTSFANQPLAGPSPPTPPNVLAPGSAYIINSGPCGIQPGQTQSVTVSGMLCSNDTTLSFLQSDKTCPLGFFVALG